MTAVMPEQHFSHPETNEHLLTVRWDLGMTWFEVYHLGLPLARVTDMFEVRSDLGMTGPLPGGSTLTLWSTRETGAETFYAAVDNEGLRPSSVTWAQQVELPPDPESLSRSERKAIAARERQIKEMQGGSKRRARPVALIVVLTAATAAAGVLYAWPRVQDARTANTAAPAPALSASPL
jgi:hypothetical protein